MQLALARKDELFNGGIIASSSFYTGSFWGCNYFRTRFSTWRRWHIQYVFAPRRSSGRTQSHKVKSTGDISRFFFPLSFLPDYSKCESRIETTAGLITGDVRTKLPSTRAHRDWSAGFGCVTPRREATVSSRRPYKGIPLLCIKMGTTKALNIMFGRKMKSKAKALPLTLFTPRSCFCSSLLLALRACFV